MITVYSKNGCPQCDKAIALLESMDIEYNVVKIDQDDEAREWLVNKGHRSVPQLYVNERLLVDGGFSELHSLTEAEIIEKVKQLNED